MKYKKDLAAKRGKEALAQASEIARASEKLMKNSVLFCLILLPMAKSRKKFGCYDENTRCSIYDRVRKSRQKKYKLLFQR